MVCDRAVESVLSTWTPVPGSVNGAGLRPDVGPSGHPDFDVEVSLPEDLADTLGQEGYASLEDRFAAVRAVAAAVFEDRDRCLLRLAPVVDAGLLRPPSADRHQRPRHLTPPPLVEVRAPTRWLRCERQRASKPGEVTPAR